MFLILLKEIDPQANINVHKISIQFEYLFFQIIGLYFCSWALDHLLFGVSLSNKMMQKKKNNICRKPK